MLFVHQLKTIKKNLRWNISPPAVKAEESALLYLKALVDLNYNNGGFYCIHCLVRIGGQPLKPFSFQKPEFQLRISAQWLTCPAHHACPSGQEKEHAAVRLCLWSGELSRGPLQKETGIILRTAPALGLQHLWLSIYSTDHISYSWQHTTMSSGMPSLSKEIALMPGSPWNFYQFPCIFGWTRSRK